LKSESLRTQAVRALLQIESEGAFTGLGRRGPTSDPRLERRLTDLVAGVTRHRRWLDFLVNSFYSGNPEKLEPAIRAILRVGIFELTIAQTPPHAVINECVNAGSDIVGKRATGLINGILRTVTRKGSEMPKPATGNVIQDLGIQFSHPDWIVQRWITAYGEENARRFLEHNNKRPVFGIRVRGDTGAAFLSSLGESASGFEESRFFPDYVRTQKMQGLLAGDHLISGRVLVQDEAAGGVVYALDPQPGERILDLCAAPGGKSLAIAERIGTSGEVVAVDMHEGRLGMLTKESERLGLENIETRVGDARTMTLSPNESGFDRVLVDAPCSGLGVLAKRADLRWRKTETSIKELAVLQSEMLTNAAQLVRAGGVLLYSTCTTEPEENEDVAENFVANHPEFSVESLQDCVPAELLTDDGAYRTLPFRDGIDGSYAVRFRKHA
jgi:16S rRNA (cytosine967-C5)-methyltransferase